MFKRLRLDEPAVRGDAVAFAFLVAISSAGCELSTPTTSVAPASAALMAKPPVYVHTSSTLRFPAACADQSTKFSRWSAVKARLVPQSEVHLVLDAVLEHDQRRAGRQRRQRTGLRVEHFRGARSRTRSSRTTTTTKRSRRRPPSPRSAPSTSRFPSPARASSRPRATRRRLCPLPIRAHERFRPGTSASTRTTTTPPRTTRRSTRRDTRRAAPRSTDRKLRVHQAIRRRSFVHPFVFGRVALDKRRYDCIAQLERLTHASSHDGADVAAHGGSALRRRNRLHFPRHLQHAHAVHGVRVAMPHPTTAFAWSTTITASASCGSPTTDATAPPYTMGAPSRNKLALPLARTHSGAARASASA